MSYFFQDEDKFTQIRQFSHYLLTFMLVEGQGKHFWSVLLNQLDSGPQGSGDSGQNLSHVLLFCCFFFVLFSGRSDAVCLIHNLWLYERASQQAFSLQIFLGRVQV